MQYNSGLARTHKKSQRKPCLYLCFHSSVVEELTHKPVKADLDGVSWLSLNDPLTTEGVFVVAWPPRGKDDTRRPWVVTSARSWTGKEVEEWWNVLRQNSNNPQYVQIFADVIKTLLPTMNKVCLVKEKLLDWAVQAIENECFSHSAWRGHFGSLPQFSHNSTL